MSQPGNAVARRGGRGYDELSLVGFIERKRALARQAAELAAEAAAMAAAAETQPLAAAVKANLDAFAAMTRAVAGAGEGLYPAARQAHADDYERVNEPRGNARGIEQKADVTAAGRDGY